MAGDMYPQVMLESVIGRPPKPSKHSHPATLAASADQNVDANAAAPPPQQPVLGGACYSGNPAGSLVATRPVHNAIVHNWDDATLLWQHAFEQELQVRAACCSAGTHIRVRQALPGLQTLRGHSLPQALWQLPSLPSTASAFVQRC